MRALYFTQIGSPVEKYSKFVDDAPQPRAEDLKPGQILVEVHHAAVNPVDYKHIETPVLNWFFGGTPAIPSQDYAGRIIAVGPGVDREDLKPGQLCFGMLEKTCSQGTLAEYTIATAKGCVALSSNVGTESAAGFGCAGLTAYQSIVPYAKDIKGTNVFLHGGSGGTGSWGIQIAKLMGCKVTVTCSTANVELCRSLGADVVIDYKTSDVVKSLSEAPEKFDLVVDNVGALDEVFSLSNHYLKKGAPYIQVGVSEMGAESIMAVLKRSVMPGFLTGRNWSFFVLKLQLDDLIQAEKWLSEGKIKCQIAESVELENSASAFTKLKGGRTKGKIIVNIKP